MSLKLVLMIAYFLVMNSKRCNEMYILEMWELGDILR